MNDVDLKTVFAPTGTMRAAINVGNPILAHRNDKGEPGGVSVDMAHALARQLDVSIEFIVFESAGQSVECVSNNEADIGFFAVDPRRAEALHFTEPYVLIEGAYLVRDESFIHTLDEVDQSGIQIAVGKGSAYDLYLTRTLEQATIVRAPTSPAVVDLFLDQDLDVAAGVKQQLQADAKGRPGLRMLPGHFMVIRQAMGLPRSRSAQAASYLSAFVEQQKASGFVADALRRHGIQGARVAPAVSR